MYKIILGSLFACLFASQVNASVIHTYEFSNAGNGGSDNGTLKFSSDGILKPDGIIESNYGDFKGTLNGIYYDFANLPSPGVGWSEASSTYRYDFSSSVIVVRAFIEFNKGNQRYTYDLRVYDFNEAIGLGSGNVTLDIRTWNPSSQIELYNTGDVGYLHTTSTVPIPATVWLFGSGLLGLIAAARRKATHF